MNTSHPEDFFLVVAWSGLPPYAAACLEELRQHLQVPFCVISTQPDVPHKNIDKIYAGQILYIDEYTLISWSDLGVRTPFHFIHTGWGIPSFNHLSALVRKEGGSTYCMVDNIWYGNFRQFIGLFVFRACYRKRFKSVFVPGRASQKFCRLLGMRKHKIYTGMYGADPKIFQPGKKLSERPKRILFVGRFIDRKGVTVLSEAFRISGLRERGWELVAIGEGPLVNELVSSGINVIPFSQPHIISEWMCSSRFFVLPSLEEHWGVVLHEAALSGCALIVSRGVGASFDLCSKENSFIIPSNSVTALKKTFQHIHTLSGEQLDKAYTASLSLAVNFGPDLFTRSVLSMTDLN